MVLPVAFIYWFFPEIHKQRLSAISYFRLDLYDIQIKILNHWETGMAISQELLDILGMPEMQGRYLSERH